MSELGRELARKKPRHKYGAYPKDLRRRAAERTREILRSGGRYADATRELGVCDASLRNWVKALGSSTKRPAASARSESIRLVIRGVSIFAPDAATVVAIVNGLEAGHE